jgi:hypothetical protein
MFEFLDEIFFILRNVGTRVMDCMNKSVICSIMHGF